MSHAFYTETFLLKRINCFGLQVFLHSFGETWGVCHQNSTGNNQTISHLAWSSAARRSWSWVRFSWKLGLEVCFCKTRPKSDTRPLLLEVPGNNGLFDGEPEFGSHSSLHFKERKTLKKRNNLNLSTANTFLLETLEMLRILESRGKISRMFARMRQ